MRPFSDYDSYVFDLYGTLVDIRTDEEAAAFWKRIAAWYAFYGADWRPAELKARYRAAVEKEETRLRTERGSAWPEIRLETVFMRLLKEAPRSHPAALRPEGKAAERAWLTATAAVFRGCSRQHMKPIPGAAALLDALRARGKRVYLLSNAQAVFTLPELEQCGLSGRFDGVAISSDYGMKKPEPAFLAALMERERLTARESVMIGNDWRSDMAVAAACGVAGIWINSDHLTLERRQAERQDIAARFGPAAAADIGETGRLSDLLKALSAQDERRKRK